MARPKKITEPVIEQQTTTTQTVEAPQFTPENSTTGQEVETIKTIQISEDEWNKTQEQLKMLLAVADKGRVFNYETQQSQQKKPMKVKLSMYNGQYIVGWQTIKDELVKHPTTGATVGEQQEYEITLLSKEGVQTTARLMSYQAFSDARYKERTECEVVGKSEDYQGNLEFEIMLPEGQKIKLSSRFIN